MKIRKSWSCECDQQDGLRLSGPSSGYGADGGARTRNRRVPADIRAGSLSTGHNAFENLQSALNSCAFGGVAALVPLHHLLYLGYVR
ncbi:hypothetical protein PoB_007717800 [Plakobranchus ocellatus]|uniref:Uncharacterized protein n=1 Tax=Plakobranchus ocellatus TaxID=259542 RepID=A0AAV4E285_9GAST|nr:hypothetical protein PoB_007717800 [Plakobranchus ocellatus]